MKIYRLNFSGINDLFYFRVLMQGCTQLLQSLSRHFTDLSLSLKPIEHFKHVAVRVIPRSLPCRKYDLGVFSRVLRLTNWGSNCSQACGLSGQAGIWSKE